LTLALTAVLFGCPQRQPPPEPEPEPARVARELFVVARTELSDEGLIDRLFDIDREDRRRAALYDALEELARSGEPEVVRIEPLGGADHVVVDLVSRLPGGGEASFSVELHSTDDETWIVGWFDGPGIEWPPPQRRRDQGLSTSPAPGDPGNVR
jgi:hypothetical protein